MSMNRLTKTPADELDYILDYSVWLAADIIDSSTWSVPAPLTEPALSTHDDDTTTVWLGGGQVGKEYKVVNTITTVAGRTKVVSFDLQIIDS